MGNFLTSVSAALIGGLVAAFIAWQLFKAERKSRKTEREVDQEKQRRRGWGEASAQVVKAMQMRIDQGQLINSGRARDIEEALMYMLLDGTEESLIMSNWVRMKLDQTNISESKPSFTSNNMQFQVIRAMLIAWVRGDTGVIETVKRQLDVDAQ